MDNLDEYQDIEIKGAYKEFKRKYKGFEKA